MFRNADDRFTCTTTNLYSFVYDHSSHIADYPNEWFDTFIRPVLSKDDDHEAFRLDRLPCVYMCLNVDPVSETIVIDDAAVDDECGDMADDCRFVLGIVVDALLRAWVVAKATDRRQERRADAARECGDVSMITGTVPADYRDPLTWDAISALYGEEWRVVGDMVMMWPADTSGSPCLPSSAEDQLRPMSEELDRLGVGSAHDLLDTVRRMTSGSYYLTFHPKEGTAYELLTNTVMDDVTDTVFDRAASSWIDTGTATGFWTAEEAQSGRPGEVVMHHGQDFYVEWSKN